MLTLTHRQTDTKRHFTRTDRHPRKITSLTGGTTSERGTDPLAWTNEIQLTSKRDSLSEREREGSRERVEQEGGGAR